MLSPAGWLSKMRCCLIAERGQCRGEIVDAVEAALRAGVRAFHLREKQATTRELYELARRLREATRRHDALLLINDRADVALAVEADGVHLGWQSLPVAEVRKIVGYERLIGKSAHNLEEAKRAAADGVDYILVGPVFDTPSKSGLVPTLGIERLAAICRAVDLPIIGLGGIDSSNAGEVIEAGADGVAVIRAILAAGDPAEAAAQLLARTKVQKLTET
jgi:thiamine-phosphate pyrophosphorylase